NALDIPNSKLRHVEKDVLIPQIMRDRAKELCSDKVQAFTKCCKETGFLMVVKCREENAKCFLLLCYYTGSWFYQLKPSDLGLFYAYWLLFYYFPRDCTPLSQLCSLVRINSSI
uniref:COX assembly mitochondrial protein n=1 Tax=Pavo cristatus TaxID=9049 RepID=A0A8C9EIX1_PAVCR